MGGSDAPTVPVCSVDEVVAQWADRGPVALVVGGFGSPREEPHGRIGLFAWPPDGGEPVLDVWVPSAALEALAGRLGDRVFRGGWDTMYATGWSLAWATGGGQARVWARGEGERCRIDGDGVFVGGSAVGGAVEAVASFLSPDWVRREVRLRLRGGGEVCVAATEEPWASAGSFFYDGLDLLADTGWVHELGGCLAGVLGVPYVDGVG